MQDQDVAPVLGIRECGPNLGEGLVDQRVDVALQRIRRLLGSQKERDPELARPPFASAA
jgi:hypothetical protein